MKIDKDEWKTLRSSCKTHLGGGRVTASNLIAIVAAIIAMWWKLQVGIS